MKLLFKILTIFFTLSVLVKAEIVDEIKINGNNRVSDETIKVYSGITEGKRDFSKQDLNNILKSIYETNFFEDVNVEIKNKVLFINLKEYPVINQLVLIGEKANRIKKEIKKNISLKEKGSFIQNDLKTDIDIIKKLYSSIGYNFAKVEAKVKNIDENNVDLILEIERGEVTKISKISFLGDKKIKEKRLRDIIASQEDKFWKFITRNTRFSENLINLDKRLLENYYKSMGYYDVQVTSSSAQVLDTQNIEASYSIDAGKDT